MRRTEETDFIAHKAMKNAIRVRAATTANVTIAAALNGGDVLDGVTLIEGDIVLVKNQSTAAENGLYIVGTVPARHPDYRDYDAHAGALVTVEDGTAQGDTVWLCTSSRGGTLETTAIAFSMMLPAAGAQPLDALLTAIAGLTMAADRYIYGTGSQAVGLGTMTAFARSLLDDAGAPAARGTLGLGGLATLNAVTDGEVDLTDTGTSVRVGQNSTGAPGFNLNAEGGAISRDGLSWYNASGGIADFARGNSGAMVQWRHGAGGGTLVGSVSVNSISTSYNTTSERRLKTDIRPMDLMTSVARIAAIRLRDFRWKIDGTPGRGVVADELQAVVPEAVTGEIGAVAEDWAIADGRAETTITVRRLPGDGGAVKPVDAAIRRKGLAPDRVSRRKVAERIDPQMVDYGKLVPDLIGAVQSLLADNAALEARVAALEAALGSTKPARL